MASLPGNGSSYTPDTPSFGLSSDQIERQQFLTAEESQSWNDHNSPNSPKHNFAQKATSLYHNNVGLLLVVASQIFFTFMNLFVKLLTALDNPVDALELIWIRMIITYACGTLYMYWMKVEYPLTGPPEIRWLLVVRGVCGFFGLFGMYFSLTYLSLSDATVLTFLAPSFTGVAGALLLKENFTRREALAGVFSLAGVVLIARPSGLFGSPEEEPTSAGQRVVTSSQRLVAVGVALVGVLGATGAYTTIRAIGTKAHAMHSLTFFSMYCVVVSPIMMVVLKTPIVIPTQWLFLLFLLLIGLFGFVAQFLLVLGLQRETASRGTIGLYTQIIFAGAVEQIILHTQPSVLSIIGTMIILSSALYVALTKQGSSQKTGSGASKRVHWEDDIEFASTVSEDVESSEEFESSGQLKSPVGRGNVLNKGQPR